MYTLYLHIEEQVCLYNELRYNLEDLKSGEHTLNLQAFDNFNNQTFEEIRFRVASSEGLTLTDVYNYPNPLVDNTYFTFQVQGLASFADLKIKIYTITGRLIRILDNLISPKPGYNYYLWDGLDDDGDAIANGVYLYKIILKSGQEQKEVTEKLVMLK